MNVDLRQVGDDVVIPVKVKPGARRNGLAGEHDQALRIDVTAAPEKGKANAAVTAVLAKTLHVAKSRIELLQGAASSRKVFVVKQAALADVRATLAQAIARE